MQGGRFHQVFSKAKNQSVMLVLNTMSLSCTQRTGSLQESQCRANLLPPFKPLHTRFLPSTLLPAGYTPSGRANSNSAPPSRRLLPLHVQHLAQQERERSSPTGHKSLERNSKQSEG